MQHVWDAFVNSPFVYRSLTYGAFGLVLFTILGALFMKTPYGRFSSSLNGYKFKSKTGWFLMELPAMISFLYFYFKGNNAFESVPLIMLFIWVMHYSYRGFMFPLRMIDHSGKKTFHFSVVLIGMIVTSLHGYLNATWISEYAHFLTDSYILSVTFIIGILVYLFGFFHIVKSDSILRGLRIGKAPDEQQYYIPKGGLFKYVSSAQYFSELVAWFGFMILTLSPGGIFIFFISAANLVPRAISTHDWYRTNFADYPEDRKILVPGLF